MYIIEYGNTDGFIFNINQEYEEEKYEDAINIFNKLELGSYEYKTLVMVNDSDKNKKRNFIKYRHWKMNSENS